MEKYELIPAQLLHEGTLHPEELFAPTPMAEADILRVHERDYWTRMRQLKLSQREVRPIGFPLSAALVDREITIAQGTLDAAHFALQYGVAMNVAGGTHHAYANRGEGFCLLNDQALAAAALLHQQKAARILIVDLDVHQGNGTASIFAHEERVFTFSMHGKDNYPYHKEQSDLDIALPMHTGDEQYLTLLEMHLSAIMQSFKPDFMFYQAGVDVLASDKLGKLSLSLEGCKQRDRMVFETAKNAQIPVVVCMGGGYSPEIKVILEAHCNTFRLAKDIFF